MNEKYDNIKVVGTLSPEYAHLDVRERRALAVEKAKGWALEDNRVLSQSALEACDAFIEGNLDVHAWMRAIAF